MSHFGHDRILSDTRPDQEAAEGVRIERRSMLRLSASTVAAALAFAACGTTRKKPEAAAQPVPEPVPEPLPEGTLEVGELLAEMYPRAQDLIASGGHQEEAYLMGISELIARLSLPTQKEVQTAMRTLADEEDLDSPRDLRIALVLFDFAPGKGFEHHDHRDYNGVIMVTDGEVRARNYDILGDDPVPPKGTTFQLRQTRDDLLLPGAFSTLSRTRDNVHEVVAGPEGGKVVDAFTFFEPDANSYFMTVDSKPRDAERGIYDAAWV